MVSYLFTLVVTVTVSKTVLFTNTVSYFVTLFVIVMVSYLFTLVVTVSKTVLFTNTVSYFVTLFVTVMVSYLEHITPSVSKIKTDLTSSFEHLLLSDNRYVIFLTPNPAFTGEKVLPEIP